MKKIFVLCLLFSWLVLPVQAQDHKYVVPTGFKVAWEVTPEDLQTEIFLAKQGEVRDDLDALLYMTTEPGIIEADIYLPEPGLWVLGMRSMEMVEDYKHTSRTIWTDVDADHMHNGETWVVIQVAPIDPPANVGVIK